MRWVGVTAFEVVRASVVSFQKVEGVGEEVEGVGVISSEAIGGVGVIFSCEVV